MQPGAGRLGIGLEVPEAEQGGAKKCVSLDAPAKGLLVGVEDEVPYRDGMVGEARADLAPVLTFVSGYSTGGNFEMKTPRSLRNCRAGLCPRPAASRTPSPRLPRSPRRPIRLGAAVQNATSREQSCSLFPVNSLRPSIHPSVGIILEHGQFE